MPELPEVETIRHDLSRRILGQRIVSVNILATGTARNSAAFLKKSLIGHSFSAIGRRGKLLILNIEKGDFLLVHLKMTGQLIYIDHQTQLAGGHSLSRHKAASASSFQDAVGGSLPNKYTRIWLEFQKGGRLFFNDLRRFGYWQIVKEKEKAEIIKEYGPEPLSSSFTVEALALVMSGRSIKIKALLLDQKRIAGLGNIYVDESLWLAGIKPTRPAGSLKNSEISRLHEAISDIIRQAIIRRGTTFSDYVDSRGRKGNFSSFLQVYGRSGKRCSRCGAVIVKKKIAGRGTHFCPRCQK